MLVCEVVAKGAVRFCRGSQWQLPRIPPPPLGIWGNLEDKHSSPTTIYHHPLPQLFNLRLTASTHQPANLGDTQGNIVNRQLQLRPGLPQCPGITTPTSAHASSPSPTQPSPNPSPCRKHSPLLPHLPSPTTSSYPLQLLTSSSSHSTVPSNSMLFVERCTGCWTSCGRGMMQSLG